MSMFRVGNRLKKQTHWSRIYSLRDYRHGFWIDRL